MPKRLIDVGDLMAGDERSGVVDQHVEPAERGHGFVDYSDHLDFLGKIAADGHRKPILFQGRTPKLPPPVGRLRSNGWQRWPRR